MEAMKIRLAIADDVPGIVAIVRRAVPLMRAAGNLQWDEAYPDAHVFLKDVAMQQLWLAETAGVPGGVAAVTTEQYAEYAQLGWDIAETAVVVHRLVVDPAQRGKGLAALLMQQAEAVAKERGIGVLRVDTNTRNEASQRLFPKLGYTLAGEFTLGFRPGMRFVGYEKRL